MRFLDRLRISSLAGTQQFPNVQAYVDRLQANSDIDGLVEALKWERLWVMRESAARALGMLGDERALSALYDALDDISLKVRLAATNALREFYNSQVDAESINQRLRERGRRAYLILLWNTQQWSATEEGEIIKGKTAELGCPVTLLRNVRVEGPFPTGPDSYVVAQALLACRQVGIPFQNDTDTISFKGGYVGAGVGLGLITILVTP